ncbi:amidohydrolase, partial [Francisella tularensis subsp. holarctica]|nr:amidohydrolase [Francisella tularensis subsp. holarctica]
SLANTDQDTDINVMCDMFNTRFIMTPTDQASTQQHIVNWMYRQVKVKNYAIVGSAASYSHDKIVNRLYFVTPEKQV